ncbi:MAG: DUF2142 domain-containing protein [Clostridia bacterium]|nr:DUF2142 domain-containing protein [Clostridia bacterium]
MKKRALSWLLLAAFLVWLLFMIIDFTARLDVRRPYVREHLNASDTLQMVTVSGAETLRQEVPLDREAEGLILYLQAREAGDTGHMLVRVMGNNTGKVLSQMLFHGADLAEAGEVWLPFDSPAETEDTGYVVEIRVEDGYPLVAFMASGEDTLEEKALTVGDREMRGDLLVSYMVPRGQRYAYALIVYGLFLAMMLGLALCIAFGKLKTEGLCALMALCIGLGYLASITPLSVPDESVHYTNTYKVASHLIGRGNREDMGHPAYFDYAGFVGQHNVGSGYDRIARELTGTLQAQEEVSGGFAGALAYPVMYLPQALGVALGRLLGRSMTGTFFLGRLTNLLFYALCVYLALKVTRRFRGLLALSALVPMALHQAASFSYDGYINGMALLFTALCMRAMAGEGRWPLKEQILTGVIGVLLMPAKPVYLPLLLLLILVPGSRFARTGHKWVCIAACVLAASLAILLFQLSGIRAVAGGGETALDVQGPVLYSVSDILRDPVGTVRLILHTLRIALFGWIGQGVGSLLSGLSLEISGWKITGYMLLLALSAMPREGEEYVHFREKAVYALILLSCTGLVMLTMLLGWTPLDATWIQGVQGRYLIPVLPLVWLCLSARGLRVSREAWRPLLLGAVMVHMAVLGEVLRVTVLS